MGPCGQSPFQIEEISAPCKGLNAYSVRLARMFIPDRDTPPDQCTRERGHLKAHRAIGRAIVLDPNKVELRIYPFYELIHRSWLPGTRNFVRFSPRINLGTSLPEFIYNDGGPELRDLKGEQGKRVRDELDRCVFACNTLQTGFIRSNGFVMAPPRPGEYVEGKPKQAELICKLGDAPGMYDSEYVSLGPTSEQRQIRNKRWELVPAPCFPGTYDAIVLQPDPRVGRFPIEDNRWRSGPPPQLAICSPIILENGKVLPACDIPFCPNDTRQTIGNEVNWNPETTCTSFTAFGVRDDGQIVVTSMFEGAQPGDAARNRGILATEMGWLMRLPELNATSGVIGGGSADAQQFLDADRSDLPQMLLAPPRPKRPEEAAIGEVEGPRGLGAIFAVLQR